MTENRRIFWNVIATYGRSLYSLAIGLFCGRWALMALGETDYGLNGLVGGLTVFISFFNGILAGANARFYAFSVGEANVADDKEAALEECRRWFNTALSVHTVVPVVLIIIGYPLGVYAIEHWLTIPMDRVSSCVWVFRFVCISCFIGMINVPCTAMYTAKQYIAELTIYGFVSTTLNVIVLHYMVTHPADWLVRYAAWSCFLSALPQIIIISRAFIIFPECRIRVAYMWDRTRLKKLGFFTGWQFLGVLCKMLRTQGVTILINKFFGARMNAAQAIGNTVQGHCNTLASAMQGAFGPVIIQACGAGDYEKMNRFVLRTGKFNVLLSVIFMVPLALELPEVLQLWLKEPPAYTVGLCYCAMALYLVGSCTEGHMIAINATGKIAAFHAVLCSVNIFTIPIAIIVGMMSHNIYFMMASIVFMECLNSLGRIVFAKKYAHTSVSTWVFRIMMPLCAATVSCAIVGYLPHMFMTASFLRVCITTALCEMMFLPLTWYVLLSTDERNFIREKIGAKLMRFRV